MMRNKTKGFQETCSKFAVLSITPFLVLCMTEVSQALVLTVASGIPQCFVEL